MFAAVGNRTGLGLAREAAGDAEFERADGERAAAAYAAAAEVFAAVGDRARQGVASLKHAEALGYLGWATEARTAWDDGERLLAGSDVTEPVGVRRRLRVLLVEGRIAAGTDVVGGAG